MRDETREREIVQAFEDALLNGKFNRASDAKAVLLAELAAARETLAIETQERADFEASQATLLAELAAARQENAQLRDAVRAAAWLLDLDSSYECGHGASIEDKCPTRCTTHRRMLIVAAALAAVTEQE